MYEEFTVMRSPIYTKSYRFLIPSLNLYKDSVFIDFFNNSFKITSKIYDWNKKSIKFSNNIYIIFYKLWNVFVFKDFIFYVRKQPFYVTDYSINKEFHIMVLKIDSFIFKNFILGKYTEMYTKKQKKLFNNDYDWDIITGKNEKNLEIEIEKEFSINLKMNMKEKSLPPTFREETINFPYKKKYFIKDNLKIFENETYR